MSSSKRIRLASSTNLTPNSFFSVFGAPKLQYLLVSCLDIQKHIYLYVPTFNLDSVWISLVSILSTSNAAFHKLAAVSNQILKETVTKYYYFPTGFLDNFLKKKIFFKIKYCFHSIFLYHSRNKSFFGVPRIDLFFKNIQK